GRRLNGSTGASQSRETDDDAANEVADGDGHRGAMDQNFTNEPKSDEEVAVWQAIVPVDVTAYSGLQSQANVVKSEAILVKSDAGEPGPQNGELGVAEGAPGTVEAARDEGRLGHGINEDAADPEGGHGGEFGSAGGCGRRSDSREQFTRQYQKSKVGAEVRAP